MNRILFGFASKAVLESAPRADGPSWDNSSSNLSVESVLANKPTYIGHFTE